MRGIRQLRSQGYNNKQCKLIIIRTWHPWLPRKIAAMNWLTMAGGLPIGAWRHKAGWCGECRICGSAGIETNEHALRTFPMVSEAWRRYALLRSERGKIMVNKNTPSNILRACILWNIWVQKTGQELNGEPFSIGKVLFHAWKTTIHIGMETEQGVFATMTQRPKWKILPPEVFLPRHIAEQVQGARNLLAVVTTPSREMDSGSNIQSKELSDAIDNLFAEVNQEIEQQRRQDLDPPPAPPSPEIPDNNIQSEMVDRRLAECTPLRTVDHIIQEASPRSARLIEQRLQDEIEELLNRAEIERHEYHSPETSPRTARATERLVTQMHQTFNDTPYTLEDLPRVVERARNTPDFPGLTALEIYAQTAQHLGEENFASWMADGRRYFDLGRRHPR
ncbi:hypothetical protein M758_7G157000, partial [Ceratodon purpureus]